MPTLDQLTTLLLDSSYRPIATISWQRAITLAYMGKVFVAETYDQVVRSPSSEFVVPAVAVLKQFLRVRPMRVRYCKTNIFRRDGHTCQYCGAKPGAANLTLDHVLPSSRGGKSTWENIVTACEPCNHSKANKTPTEAGLVLRAKPVRPLPTLNGVINPAGTPPEWEFYLAAG